MAEYVRAFREVRPGVWEWESVLLPAGGGGSLPAGLGDYVSADTTSTPSIPNDGGPHDIALDDGVIAGGAGSVTLDAGQVFINLAHAGIYAISVEYLFDDADPTGTRTVGIQTAGGGSHDSIDQANSEGSITGATTYPSGVADSSTNWIGPFNAAAQFKLVAVVTGAAGAVQLTYVQVTVCFVSPLGT